MSSASAPAGADATASWARSGTPGRSWHRRDLTAWCIGNADDHALTAGRETWYQLSPIGTGHPAVSPCRLMPNAQLNAGITSSPKSFSDRVTCSSGMVAI